MERKQRERRGGSKIRRFVGHGTKPRRRPRGRRSGAIPGFRVSSFPGYVLILLATAMAIGVVLGVMLPRINGTMAVMTGKYRADGDAARTLDRLVVEDHPKSGRQYRRDSFGFKETDEDGNGCNIREDVLTRDLSEVVHTGPGRCKVSSGVLHDPYTGETITFKRGERTSAAVQIDHVVALENAWRSGASTWDEPRRYHFGNDPYNLLAVDGSANQEKGSASADHWLPPRSGYQCAYVARQIGVKDKYALSVTSSEKRAMMGVLHGCPGQSPPDDDGLHTVPDTDRGQIGEIDFSWFESCVPPPGRQGRYHRPTGHGTHPLQVL